MGNVLIETKNLNKTYTNTGTKNKVIDNVNLKIYEGDFTVIMGSSGAGKSTLLYALSGMDEVTGGSIIYKGKDITKYSEKEMSELRKNEFGFVFQATHLISNLTLFENIVVAGYLTNKKEKEVNAYAEELLSKMNLKDAKERLPIHTSGGEAQRAAIARAMINNPSIIFADEPTGALNKNNSNEVLNLLTSLNNQNQSILMVTHDIRAASHGNRILYLEDGQIMGEKILPKYDETKLKMREEELTAWLQEMNW